MSLKTFLILSLLFVSMARADDEEPPSAKGEATPLVSSELAAFMKNYGYLKEGNENNMESVEEAIKNMQLFGGLEVTGKLNDATLALLKAPRCGAADLEDGDLRGKRFLTSNRKWSDMDLTHHIFNYPTNTEGMSNADVDAAILKSFQRWSAAAPNLKFSATADENAVFKVRFSADLHTDKYAFDGKGGILAHAFYPTSGNVHFDDAETWVKTTPTDSGAKYLEFVATHELGHGLGLKHSTESGAVMQAYYPGYEPDFVLGADDIAGIQSLYG